MSMTQKERLLYLIQYLKEENKEYQTISIPKLEAEQKQLLRSLMNVRPPMPISEQFLKVQDDYLTEEARHKEITGLSGLTPMQKNIYLWKGDITTLRTDAIVNAANSALLGCFVPCHGCIDNAIHSAAGIQLRLACNKLMNQQKGEEPAGKAKITRGYNLPCQYVIHTVGPIIYGRVTEKDKMQLASCYRSCLELAAANNLKSIAFCCISTGEFHFPNKLAAGIAVETVKEYKQKADIQMEVVFNVFQDTDYKIYQGLLKTV